MMQQKEVCIYIHVRTCGVSGRVYSYSYFMISFSSESLFNRISWNNCAIINKLVSGCPTYEIK